MSELLWHKVSEKEKQEISKKAKAIMDSFSKRLEKVKVDEETGGVNRKEFERQEKDAKSQDLNREIMFQNAPEHQNGFIIGGRKEW